MDLRFLAILALTLLTSLRTSTGQVEKPSSVVQFPTRGATNVSPDTHLVLTFSEPPAVGKSGDIRVFDAGDGHLVDILDLAIPAGPPPRSGRGGGAAATQEPTYQKDVIGGFEEGFHFFPVIVHDRTATITLHHGVLQYGHSYFVKIDPGVLTVAGFNGFQDPKAWTFRTRSSPPPSDSKRIVVAADGSGDFATVQGAVDFVPDEPRERVTIFIKSGTYEEIVYFRNKRDITFLGEDRSAVVIGYANNEVFNGPPPRTPTNELPTTFPYRRASFFADHSTGIHIVNLTLRNFTPQGGSQAEALLLSGGRNIVTNVSAYSYQDTVQFNDTVYIADSSIEGETDFLWGRGPAYFNHVDLKELSNSPYMWVRSTAASHGFIFVDSRFLTASTSGAGPFLARNTAQYPDSEIVLIDAKLGRINPAAWSFPDDPGRMRYWESNSVDLETNRAADVSRRHQASKQLDRERDATVIAQYRDPVFVLGGWKPEMAPIILAPPKSTSANAGDTIKLNVTIAAVPPASIEWRHNGRIVEGAKTSELTISGFRRGDAGRYSVIATNSAGRVESTAAVVTSR